MFTLRVTTATALGFGLRFDLPGGVPPLQVLRRGGGLLGAQRRQEENLALSADERHHDARRHQGGNSTVIFYPRTCHVFSLRNI